jgi:hypothetical protein
MTDNINFTKHHYKINDTNLNKRMENLIPASEKEWTYDKQCQSCKLIFGYISNRQHHCRSCARSFCWNCCDRTHIPLNLINIPQEQTSYKESMKHMQSYIQPTSGKKTVCKGCSIKIKYLNIINPYINIIKFCDIKTIYNSSISFKKLYDSSTYILSKIKNIQFKDIIHLNSWEKNMILISGECFIGHKIWSKIYIKCLLYEYLNNETSPFKYYEYDDNSKRILSCSQLCCSYECLCENNIKLGYLDLFEIFGFIIELDNNKDIFWNNQKMQNIVKNMLLNIKKEKILLKQIIGLFVNILMKLLKYVEKNKNNDLIREIFECLIFDQELLYMFMTDIDILKSFQDENEQLNKLQYFIKYYAKNNTTFFDLNHYKTIIKMNKFINEELYIINREKYTPDLHHVNSFLPIIYPFNQKYNIIKIKKIISMTHNNYGFIRGKIIICDIDNNKEIEEKKFVIYQTDKLNEYYSHLFIYIIKNIINCETFIYDKKQITKDVIIVEINNNDKVLSDIFKYYDNIKDYIFETKMDKTLENIIKNYTSSLSFIYIAKYILDLNIYDYDKMLINNDCQIYISDFINNNKIIVNDDENNLPLISLIGSKSINYQNFMNNISKYHNLIKENYDLIKYIGNNVNIKLSRDFINREKITIINN